MILYLYKYTPSEDEYFVFEELNLRYSIHVLVGIIRVNKSVVLGNYYSLKDLL